MVAEHSVTFSCAAESLPLPKLELRFNSKTIGWFQNGRFAMQSVNVSHQGLYECVPHNLLGSGPIVRINLTVLGEYLMMKKTKNVIWLSQRTEASNLFVRAD